MDGTAFDLLWASLSLDERDDMLAGNHLGACWRQNVSLVEKLRQNSLLETYLEIVSAILSWNESKWLAVKRT